MIQNMNHGLVINNPKAMIKGMTKHYLTELDEKELKEIKLIPTDIYDNKIKYSVTLKSHLFENDGKYVFNDLMQSPEVWTEINGQQYAIIIDTVSVEETDRNNIYEATVKYHYSQEPSLI